MRSIAEQILYKHVRTVGLEGDTIWAMSELPILWSEDLLTVSVIDVGVLNHDIRTSICVPSVSILGRVRTYTAS